MSPLRIDSNYPAGQVRLPAHVRQYWVGRPHVHHGHRPRLLQRLARRKVQDERGREKLQRLFLHVLLHDVPRVYHGNSDPVQVNTIYKVNFDIYWNFITRYTSYVKPEIPLGNIQNGAGSQGKVSWLLFRSTDRKYILSSPK